jgi:hypothetical protein
LPLILVEHASSNSYWSRLGHFHSELVLNCAQSGSREGGGLGNKVSLNTLAFPLKLLSSSIEGIRSTLVLFVYLRARKTVLGSSFSKNEFQWSLLLALITWK